MVCLTTTDTLSVATAAGSIQTQCAAFPAGGGPAKRSAPAGAWVRDVCADATGARVIFTSDPDPFKPAHPSDENGAGCDAMTWNAQTGTWSPPEQSFCACAQLPGTECSDDVCFTTKGRRDATGTCVLPDDAVPYCPSGTRCTGAANPADRCR
jgi:hypothetical protein